jgi:aminoglycoside 6'-N-acetyltransferase
VSVVARPEITLHGPRVLLRAGTAADAPALIGIWCEPEVRQWWRSPPSVEQLTQELLGEDDTVPFVIVVAGEVVGLVQYLEETDPDYRHASIDIFLSARVHGRGLGTEAVAVLAAYLIDVRGHHRLTIDPSAANAVAIRAYTKAGFRPVGLMRRYERGADGEWHDGLLMDLLADELVRAE